MRYRINQEKMNVVLRNKMISSAAERRLYDSGAGVVVEALLQLAGDTVAPRPASHQDILKEKIIEKQVHECQVQKLEVQKCQVQKSAWALPKGV